MVEQRLVRVGELVEVDVPLEVVRLARKLLPDPLRLALDGLDGRGEQPFET